MKISELPSYQEIIQYLAKKNRQKHLLFGNGFSIAYDSEIFSYNALSKFIDEIDNDLLKKPFQVINNQNFDLAMQQVDNFIEIAKALTSDVALIHQITEDKRTLTTTLLVPTTQNHTA